MSIGVAHGRHYGIVVIIDILCVARFHKGGAKNRLLVQLQCYVRRLMKSKVSRREERRGEGWLVNRCRMVGWLGEMCGGDNSGSKNEWATCAMN